MKYNSMSIKTLIVCMLFVNINLLYSQMSIDKSRSNAITTAVEKVSPTVVGINVEEIIQYSSFNDPFYDFFSDMFGNGGGNRVVEGLGSGFIISNDGYILTNYHVAGQASKITVTMSGGEKYDAKIIGADKTTDIALLKIDVDTKLPYIKFAKSKDVLIGEWAIAFGNPFGLFDINSKPTVTVGVVSNTGLDFVQEENVFKGMIQTDAAISSGNSGGPLVNANGELIGMNTVIFSTATNRAGAGSIGIGWAIPSDRLQQISDKLRKDKKINRNYSIGLEAQQLNERIAKRYNINVDYGLIVTRTYNGSSADAAGIEPGDVILEIDNKKIRKTDDFYLSIFDGEVGNKYNFLILRDKDRINLTYTLKERK